VSKPKKKIRSYSVEDDEDLALQPWFLPLSIAWQVRKILPSVHLAKLRYYFDDHGCLRCAKKNVLYGSNGLCENCGVIVRSRLKNCLKRRLRAVGVREMENYADQLETAVKSARDILRRPAGGSRSFACPRQKQNR
jgi:hypothetical protein